MDTDPTVPERPDAAADVTALEVVAVDADGDVVEIVDVIAVETAVAPSTEALTRLEAELAELEAELAELEAADDGGPV